MGKIVEKLREKYQVDAEQTALIDAIEVEFENSISERTSSIESLFNDFKGKTADIETINALRQEIESLKDNKTQKEPSLREALRKDFEKVKTAIRERQPFEIQVKHQRLPALMTIANTMTADLKKSYAVDDGWDAIRYPDNFIVDVIGGIEVDVVPPIVKKKLEKSVEGNATLVQPSGLKPLISTGMDVAYFEKIKYAALFELEEEVKSYEEIYAKILELLNAQVIRDYKDGTFTWLSGIAAPYVSSALTQTMVQPTLGAAVSAIALQIAALNFSPDVAYMNIADIEVSKWEQAPDGHFLMPPVANLGTSLKVYSDNSIPQGMILVGDTSTVSEMHSALTVRFGGYTSTAKFENNQEAGVIEIFSLPYLLTRNVGSWVYNDITSVLTDLEAPAVP